MHILAICMTQMIRLLLLIIQLMMVVWRLQVAVVTHNIYMCVCVSMCVTTDTSTGAITIDDKLIYHYIMVFAVCHPSVSGNLQQLTHVIYMQHARHTPEQSTATTQLKEARQWKLWDGQDLIHLIMKMPIHFLSNGDKQCPQIEIHLLEITLSISMRLPRRRQDQFYITHWTPTLWRCNERNAIKTGN